jgi:speckle-type POZ protein
MVLDDKCTFNFLIYLDGNVSNYSHQQCDRLLKEQLWATVGSVKHFSSDVELVVNDRTFWVHKAVLAARSPVFAKECKREDPCAEVYKLEIEEAEDPLIVEQFLHFIYTGESNHMLFNSNELRKLADRYQLPILSSLCRVADEKKNKFTTSTFSTRFE